MHHSILAHRVLVLAGALGATAAIIVLAAFTLAGGASAAQCEGKQVMPSQDLDLVVNSDPADAATTFCVQGNANGTPATYNLSNTLILRNGDKLIGPQVPLVRRGPASYPATPLVNLRNGNHLTKLVEMTGSDVVVKWVDVAGAETRHTADGGPVNGTGIGIGASQADATSRIRYVVSHDNLAMGINGTKGKVLNSNLYNNGGDRVWWGFGAAAAKTTFESEWGFNYVHDNPANGLWADHDMHNTPEQGVGGWHVHDNLVVDNGRWGVRFEYSAILPAGVHSPEGSETTHPNVLVEDNRVAGNGYGALIQQAAQQGLWRNNTLGSQTVAGVSYAGNGLGIVGSDSKQSTELWDADFYNNVLNGDGVQGCQLPDAQVDCRGNTP
jgi:hypothetical protein